MNLDLTNLPIVYVRWFGGRWHIEREDARRTKCDLRISRDTERAAAVHPIDRVCEDCTNARPGATR